MMKSLVSVLLVSALIATGCGDDANDHDATSDAAATAGADTSGAASMPADAPAASSEMKGCAFITEAEATTALGVPVKYRSNDGSANCILDETKEGGGLSVDFEVYPDASGYDITARQAGAAEVNGVGEKAVYVGMGSMGQLAAVKNGKMFRATISNMGGESGDLRSKAEAFAAVIVAKM